MLNKRFAIALALLVLAICYSEGREEGPHDMADALRMLQELDRYYTQAARPRAECGGVPVRKLVESSRRTTRFLNANERQ
ncbi:hypothetical protein EVAR_57070_1 [Eumeta japonica]|uniref:Neuropeptide F n=1 Tax=Eumeta variegata TaxID=151549 RepID=A0A4C1YAL4_EUMVA|nr:hypothetical protein EVAR_57070_1 [Eumeta japonica]